MNKLMPRKKETINFRDLEKDLPEAVTLGMKLRPTLICP